MRGQKDLLNSGLIRLNGPDRQSSAPGIYRSIRKIVVPLSLKEKVNSNKLVNIPEKVNLPVRAKEKILEKSKPSKSQDRFFSGNRNKKRNNEESFEREFLKSRKGKKNLKPFEGFSYY